MNNFFTIINAIINAIIDNKLIIPAVIVLGGAIASLTPTNDSKNDGYVTSITNLISYLIVIFSAIIPIVVTSKTFTLEGIANNQYLLVIAIVYTICGYYGSVTKNTYESPFVGLVTLLIFWLTMKFVLPHLSLIWFITKIGLLVIAGLYIIYLLYLLFSEIIIPYFTE